MGEWLVRGSEEEVSDGDQFDPIGKRKRNTTMGLIGSRQVLNEIGGENSTRKKEGEWIE